MSQTRSLAKSKDMTAFLSLKSEVPPRERFLVEEFSEESGDAELKKNFVVPYLQDLFQDLMLRSLTPEAIQAQALDKLTFLESSGLPCIIAERLFFLFNKNVGHPHSHQMGQASFVHGMSSVFIDRFENKAKLIFDM